MGVMLLVKLTSKNWHEENKRENNSEGEKLFPVITDQLIKKLFVKMVRFPWCW